MQAKVSELRAGNQVLCPHHREVLALGRIDENKGRLTLKESRGSLSLRLGKPIPITQLNCEPLIAEKRNELLKLVEFVFAR